MPLHFVKHSEIDFAKWDEALGLCYNENPYGYSSWLSLVSPGWGAFLNDDYSILVPVPLKKKLGITYVSQPRFTQQLGTFSLHPAESDIIKEVLIKIAKAYPKVHLQLNMDNPDSGLNLPRRMNYVLELNSSYENLSGKFSTNHKRNMTKALTLALEENLEIVESADRDLFVKLFRETVGLKDASLGKKDYELMREVLDSPNGQILFCKDPSGEMLAGLFYLKSKTKLVNLFNFITSPGKDKKTMYFLLNYWIKMYATSGLTLDFEGSEISSLARFYSGFGATARNYQIFTKKGFWRN